MNSRKMNRQPPPSLPDAQQIRVLLQQEDRGRGVSDPRAEVEGGVSGYITLRQRLGRH